jgi:hypothetical protein
MYMIRHQKESITSATKNQHKKKTKKMIYSQIYLNPKLNNNKNNVTRKYRFRFKVRD